MTTDKSSMLHAAVLASLTIGLLLAVAALLVLTTDYTPGQARAQAGPPTALTQALDAWDPLAKGS
ncbi:MAG: hypothetical protein AAF495_05100 [Pseudomonadota bacterium]